jgi:hypothetical protein
MRRLENEAVCKFDNQSFESGSVEVYVCVAKCPENETGAKSRRSKCHAGMRLKSSVFLKFVSDWDTTELRRLQR